MNAYNNETKSDDPVASACGYYAHDNYAIFFSPGEVF